jgi:FMN phosphatase YigB (HAD superfamily)
MNELHKNDQGGVKAVVFDLGKVLLDFDYRIAMDRLLRRSASSTAELMQLMTQTDWLLQYEAGAMDSRAFFEKIRGAIGYQEGFEEFKAIFGDIFTPIEPMIQLHRELRTRKLRTYIFSNTNEMAVDFIRGRFPFFSQFDGYIYSYQEKAMKPEALIYQRMEQLSGYSGHSLFYLDDRAENVAAGAARGWRTVVHETPEKTRAAMVQAGLL